MADHAYISCINKQPRNDIYHRILNVGGVHNGERWKISVEAAIQHLESGRWEFTTKPPVGHGMKVVVAVRLGRKYLKTEADYDTPDNLLSLPECP